MRKPHLTVIAALLALICIATIFQVASPYLLAPAKWEYRIGIIPDETFPFEMDALGADGWEAVSARRASSGPGAEAVFSYEIIFKRRVGVFGRKPINP